MSERRKPTSEELLAVAAELGGYTELFLQQAASELAAAEGRIRELEETLEAGLGWDVLPGEFLLELLRRAHAGEDPDLLYAEVYANAEREQMEGDEPGMSRVTQFDPRHPEKGWQPATPIPEPRLWRLWRFLRLMPRRAPHE